MSVLIVKHNPHPLILILINTKHLFSLDLKMSQWEFTRVDTWERVVQHGLLGWELAAVGNSPMASGFVFFMQRIIEKDKPATKSGPSLHEIQLQLFNERNREN